MDSEDENKELDPILLKKKQREQEFINELDDIEERHQIQNRKKKKSEEEETIKLEIPGPAGDVLDLVKKSTKSTQRNMTQISQIDKNEFDKKPWKEILEDIEINHNISKIRKQGNQVKKNKEKMGFIIKNVIRFEIDALVSLLDPTGEIEGTISKDVIDEYPKILTPGTAILVESCSIFSPSPIVSHVIITKKNIKKVATVESTRPTLRIVNSNSQEKKKIEKKPNLFQDINEKMKKLNHQQKEKQTTLTEMEREKPKEIIKEIVKEKPKQHVQEFIRQSQVKSVNSNENGMVIESSKQKSIQESPKTIEKSIEKYSEKPSIPSIPSINSWKGQSVLESEEKLNSLKESFGAFDEEDF